MYSLVLLGCVSFTLSLFLTPLLRNLFRGFGVLDRPDRIRKMHGRPIPRAGGIAIALSYLGAFAFLLVSPLNGGAMVALNVRFACWLIPAVALVFLTGLLDDLLGLTPWQKLIGQVGAAALAFWAGIRIQGIGGAHFDGELWWSLPLTVLWLVGCTNAFNLIDGMDGLAAGIGLFATMTTMSAALLQHNIPLALATVPLAGCLLGFLRFNFNPASIFLGDSGSFLIGFLLGIYAVLWSQKSATILGMTAPIMALSIPLLDTSIAIARRFLRRKSILSGDRGHIHHRLLDRGLTPRRVALLLYAACGLGAVYSLLQSVAQNQFAGVVLVLFCASAWIGVQSLGYVEFGVAGRMFFKGAFLRVLSSQIAVQHFWKELAAASDPEDCWQTVCHASEEFGFSDVHIVIAGREYTLGLADEAPIHCFTIRIPLGNGDYVQLARELESLTLPPTAVPFIEALHGQLLEKREIFAQESSQSRKAPSSESLETSLDLSRAAAGGA